MNRLSVRSLRSPFAGCLLAVLFLACRATEPVPDATAAEPAPPSDATPPVVEVRTTDYAFHAPSELASGWTTFRMSNEGEEPHFLVLWRLPEGKSFDDYVEAVYHPFMDLFGKYKTGALARDEMLEQLVERLPDWLDLVNMGRGGVGLVSPGRTAQSSVELVPGDYVMECYMVDAVGEAHSKLGMLRPLTVTSATTGAAPPEGDVELTLTNSGIDREGAFAPGRQTIRVVVAEAAPGFLGHDVHLARLDEDDSIEDVVAWMDWIDGLDPPAPAEFLGGAEQVPPGHASTFTVDLEPGRYLLVSEGYGQNGLVEEFRIE